MFSHNGMISGRQMRRILSLSVFSGSIFVLPYLFACMFGDSFVTGIIIFFIMSALYVGLVFFTGRSRIGRGALEEKNNACIRVETAVFIVRYIIRLIFYIVLAVAILCEGQVPFTDKGEGNSFGNLIVLLPLLIVAYYGSNRNLEKQGRINEMIFWTAFFPYVIMIFFGLREMDYSVLIPHGGVSLDVLIRCYALLTFIVPVEIYPQLKLNTEKKEKSEGYISVLLMVILVSAISIIIAGIYGLNGMAEEPMVSVAIMRYIELPLGVLQRFDMLMVWFFMTGVFAVISGLLFRIRKQLFKVVSKEMGEIILFVIVIASLFVCRCLPEYAVTLDSFVVYGAFVDVPLSVLAMVLNGVKR